MFQKENNQNSEGNDIQDLDNLVGFFDLLLKIDRRNNPELYKQND